MEKAYTIYDEVTREVLDTVAVGDLVKFNDWRKPMRVVGVSANFFVMVQKQFGKVYYSVCEKRPCDFTRNAVQEGQFRTGPDDWIFGCSYGYDWDSKEFIARYLEDFEKGENNLSVRRALGLCSIAIKKGSPEACHGQD